MCSYVTKTTEISGSGYRGDDWIDLRTAVVAFDHPQDARLEHALCIDFRAAGTDPAAHVAVELDEASARRLAESILATLESSAAGDPADGGVG